MTSYCGKNCETCELRKELHCPGCKEGPGRMYAADGCKIAECCRDKAKTGCEVCEAHEVCQMYKKRNLQSYKQLEKEIQKKEEDGLEEAQVRVYSYLYSNFRYLFIASIASAVLGFLDDIIPPLQAVLLVINIAILIFTIVIFFRLSVVESDYRKTAICYIVRIVIAALVVVAALGDALVVGLLLAAVSSICDMVRVVFEYRTHAVLLEKKNRDLSDQWDKLWKIMLAALIGTVLLSFCSSLFALIAAIILLVTEIAYFVLLYKTKEEYAVFQAPVDHENE